MITVDADGAIELLDGMSERSHDLSEVLTVVASDLKSFADDAFEQARAPSGRPWQPLAAATVKKRRNGSSTPLVDTGVLRNSISAQIDGPSTVLVGTNVPYAEFHQWGTVHIPARPFLPFGIDGELVDEGPSAEMWQHFERLVGHYIETGEILKG